MSRLLNADPSAYSNLALPPDERIACPYEGRGLSGLELTAGFSLWLHAARLLDVIGGISQDLQGAGERSPVVFQKMGAGVERLSEYMNPASRSGFGDACTQHIVTRQSIHR